VEPSVSISSLSEGDGEDQGEWANVTHRKSRTNKNRAKGTTTAQSNDNHANIQATAGCYPEGPCSDAGVLAENQTNVKSVELRVSISSLSEEDGEDQGERANVTQRKSRTNKNRPKGTKTAQSNDHHANIQATAGCYTEGPCSNAGVLADVAAVQLNNNPAITRQQQTAAAANQQQKSSNGIPDLHRFPVAEPILQQTAGSSSNVSSTSNTQYKIQTIIIAHNFSKEIIEHPVKIQKTLQRLKPEVNIKKVSKLLSGDIRIFP
jgi:hypothetical protein